MAIEQKVTGSLLSRLDRISIVLMKNAKKIEIEILKFPKKSKSKFSNFQKIPDSEKSLASSRELIVQRVQKKVARDARGRVRRLELRGRGAMGFFLPGSHPVFVIFRTYTVFDYRDVF